MARGIHKRQLGVALLYSAVLVPEAVCGPASMSIIDYIQQTWKVLTRSNRSLASMAADPKFPPGSDGRWPVYVPKNEFVQVTAELRREMQPSDFPRIDLRQLPDDHSQIREQGLLYLPRPYAVPGGRFNEMYGWDSFFIQMGLIRDGQMELAKDMADNFLYEIRQYGKVLNANRTYYLTRSQPPFLTEMLLAVYKHTHDLKWLEDSVPAIEAYYRYWTSEPHLTPGTGLSRYFDLGEGPAPEVLASEHDARGRTDYDLVREYFRKHRIADYEVSQFYDRAKGHLTAAFYKADRSMRESGFDPSSRFGPFGADITHYNPVCLNSLLYLMEAQTAEILSVLHREAEAAVWKQRATSRARQMNLLMWDARDGLYYDYDVVHRRVRRYPFLTTFYPLWAGIASRDQAALIVASLPRFERSGGLLTSEFRSGDQWDAPFGWAPLEWIAIEGLRRYDYRGEAGRISKHFLSLIVQEFASYGAIDEKYDVVRRSAKVDRALRYGYHSNEAGFGWTNAVFTSLFDQLSKDEQRWVLSQR